MQSSVHPGAALCAALLSAVAAALAGCANLPSSTPELARFDPHQGYRFTQTTRGADNTSSLLVVLTFPGGGKRAAALAHGILKELAAIDIEWEGRRRRLIDEVDFISDDLQFVMIDADFEALQDEAEREALMRIPTSWSLDAATVARIRVAARTLLAESAPFQQLLRDLRARPRASELGP